VFKQKTAVLHRPTARRKGGGEKKRNLGGRSRETEFNTKKFSDAGQTQRNEGSSGHAKEERENMRNWLPKGEGEQAF